MSIVDDFNRPLDQVENVVLRRSVAIVASILFVPIAMFMGLVFGALVGVWEAVEVWWTDFITQCW